MAFIHPNAPVGDPLLSYPICSSTHSPFYELILSTRPLVSSKSVTQKLAQCRDHASSRPCAAAYLPPSPSCLLPATSARLPSGPCIILALLWCQMWLHLRPLPTPPHGTALHRRHIVDELLCPRRTQPRDPPVCYGIMLCRLP
jgi:hypothetical protein